MRLTCNKLKTKFLNKDQIKLLPKEIRESEDCWTFNNNVTLDGKALLLLALVPMIIVGISALLSAAGTAASVALSNKQANEEQRQINAV